MTTKESSAGSPTGYPSRHTAGTREEGLAARLELLEAEKEPKRRSDELARRRQELPWVRIDKEGTAPPRGATRRASGGAVTTNRVLAASRRMAAFVKGCPTPARCAPSRHRTPAAQGRHRTTLNTCGNSRRH